MGLVPLKIVDIILKHDISSFDLDSLSNQYMVLSFFLFEIF